MNLMEPRVNDSGVVGCHGELQFHFIPDVSKGRTTWKNFWTLQPVRYLEMSGINNPAACCDNPEDNSYNEVCKNPLSQPRTV